MNSEGEGEGEECSIYAKIQKKTYEQDLWRGSRALREMGAIILADWLRGTGAPFAIFCS